MTCPGAAGGLGAYVLRALEPGERAELEQHLRGCPRCTAELEELRALPGLLSRVRPEELRPVAVAPSPDLFERLSAAAAPPPRVRARTWAVVAAAVLALLGAGIGVLWGMGGSDRTVTASAGPVRATVTASSLDDGSALVVSVAGMRPGEQCSLVAVDISGDRHPAGTWSVSAAGDGTWRGWADVDRDHLTEVVLEGDGGRELVRVRF